MKVTFNFPPRDQLRLLVVPVLDTRRPVNGDALPPISAADARADMQFVGLHNYRDERVQA